jgi:membrane protein involved in colicin uptake
MKQGKPVLGFSMNFKFFLSVLFSTSLWAGSFGIVKGSYQFQSHSEYQTILNQIKNFPESTVPNIPQMSRGQQMVEAAKAKNRAILAQRNQNEEKKVQESKDMSDLDFLKKEDKKNRESWKKEVQSQLKEWKREQEVFLGRLKTYQQNTFEIPVKKEVIIEKKIVEVTTKAEDVQKTVEAATTKAESAATAQSTATQHADAANKEAQTQAAEVVAVKAESVTKNTEATKAAATSTVAAKIATAAKDAAAKVPAKAVPTPTPSTSASKNSATATVSGLKPGQKIKVTVNVKGK